MVALFLRLPVSDVTMISEEDDTVSGDKTYGIGAPDSWLSPPLNGLTGFLRTIPLFSAIQVPSKIQILLESVKP